MMSDIRKIKNKTSFILIAKDRLKAPFKAIDICLKSKKTLKYIRKTYGWKRWFNTILVYWYISGENVGAGVIDPIFKFFPSLCPYPLEVELEHITLCNVNCVQCEYSRWDPQLKLPNGKPYKGQMMSLDQYKHIYEEFPKLIWTNPTGEGSPFLNKDFIKAVEYLKKRNVYVCFSCEGFNWNHEISERVVKAGVDKIWFSIDGATKETYQKIRVGSNFDKVWENVIDLIEEKKKQKSMLPQIVFHFTPMSINRHELLKFIDLVADLKDKYGIWVSEHVTIDFQQVLVSEKTKHLKYEPTTEEVDSVYKRGDKRGVEVFYQRPSYEENTKPPGDCCVVWKEPYILINGDIVPCCACIQRDNRPWLHKYTFGNIFKTPFKEIWNSTRYKKFRKMVVNPKAPVPILCQGCTVFNFENRRKKYGISKDV
jgi:radical SAM protein with 4Fe4S-binding SPASM domain